MPVRMVQHKSHILKVTFLAAVARPRWNSASNSQFSGLIGIWPFTEQRLAQCNSGNGAAGTMETICVEVNKERYKRMLVDQMMPKIKEVWPAGPNRTIHAQQDNAPSHRISTSARIDPELLGACQSDGFDIKLINQPPNSPACNVQCRQKLRIDPC